jgi:hypothetical protein
MHDNPLGDMINASFEQRTKIKIENHLTILFNKAKQDNLLITFLGNSYHHIDHEGVVFDEPTAFMITQTFEQIKKLSENSLEGTFYQPGFTGSVTGSVNKRKISFQMVYHKTPAAKQIVKPEKDHIFLLDADPEAAEEFLKSFGSEISPDDPETLHYIIEKAFSDMHSWKDGDTSKITEKPMYFEGTFKEDRYRGKWSVGAMKKFRNKNTFFIIPRAGLLTDKEIGYKTKSYLEN